MPEEPLLPVELGPIAMKELRAAVKKLKSGKAAGPDGEPIEFWKAIVNSGNLEASSWLLSFCNAVWEGKEVPTSWHLQEVAVIFKKGDPAECSNYRPICLLACAYKIFAMVLLGRLLHAGAEARLWGTQFAFRRGRGTEDALFCVRRAIELAWSQRGGTIHLLALDWAKAFDSISSTALLQALRKFGIPEPFVTMVASIYNGRRFQVAECGSVSEQHCQHSGICQGCPLSPFLFTIVMSILMANARKMLSSSARKDIECHRLFDILYADDTLICGACPASVEEYAAAVEKAGSEFGLCLHWGKTQALAVCADGILRDPQGNRVEDTGSMVYLGALLTADGRADSELSRRIGLAAGDFRSLRRFWGHANISRARKLELFHALVVSKLQYCLSSVWLVTSQRRRLDGFYARCLRRLLGIPSAFMSRVSNKTVYQRAQTLPLSEQILKRQLILLGKVARSPEHSPLRQDVFIDDGFLPQIGRYIRRVGRPRQNWLTEVWNAGVQRFGSAGRLEDLLQDPSDQAQLCWRREVQRVFQV